MKKGRNIEMKKPVGGLFSLFAVVAIGSGAVGCTGQIPNSFRLSQQNQEFNAQIDINTKIDLLWVVDNSASMDTVQDKLRNGMAGFATKYMQPTWDIRVAVITTDTYLANTAYQNYFNGTYAATTGWQSPYLHSRTATFNDSTFVNSSGTYVRNVKYSDLYPIASKPNYAKLLAGMHDGPIAAFCQESLPYFLGGETQCNVRDLAGTTGPGATTGTANCLHPGSGQTAITQCVNTTQNDTVHSGKAIISTMPASTLTGGALTAWTQQLSDDFTINATTGAGGSGSERGMQSVLQLIADNEGSATKFFRPGSVRGIIFVTDEDDQTMVVDSPVPGGYQPFSHYMCDLASLTALNGAAKANAYCCSGGGCQFGAEGTSCSSKTVDTYTYTIGICPNPTKLVPVSTIKSQLDSFFLGLDSGSTDPNYFVAVITPLTGATLQALHTARLIDDANADAVANGPGAMKNKASDRGDRYLALANLVPGSVQLDLGASDYSPLLDQIGQAIIQKKSTFPLSRVPTGQEDMIVTIIHADGSSAIIPNTSYTISGSNVVITDLNLVLSFAATDKLTVNYQPKYVNQ